MFAVVKVGGKQYPVRPGENFVVDRLEIEPGSVVELPTLLVSDDEGTRHEDGTVTATVLEHFRGPKIYIQKHKPKRGYKKKIGFRSALTRLSVNQIS